MPARLALEDGLVLRGSAFGAEKSAGGEVVFNTSLTGYQEILTDPSYRGQIVTMTCPQIGNYGVNPEDDESARPWVEGFVVRDLSQVRSNFRSTEDLGAWLKRRGVPGITGVDTRAITRRLRTRGALRGWLAADPDEAALDDAELVRLARAVPEMSGRDLARDVTCAKPYVWTEGFLTAFDRQEGDRAGGGDGGGGRPWRVAALDYGIKRHILRCLVELGAEVTVFPATATAPEILDSRPDGIFLSNGPGDPAPVTYAIETIRRLIGVKPIFGICLGHQLLGLALGGKTYKLKFGHHGGNHPVKHLATGKVEITAQNHGFAVDVESLAGKAELTHVNLNDQTVEGFRHRELPLFCVQYHPEASPGPHDSFYLFRKFRELVREAQR